MALIRKIFWFAVFVFSTLCFVVLFESGSNHFAANLQKRLGDVTQVVRDQIKH
ncbi:MAG: hypothetical protein PHQ12_14855 [Chthoniobacteraceae bacterium]|nr:hypothetical protein [Chthoniobacteraceae bacterium]